MLFPALAPMEVTPAQSDALFVVLMLTIVVVVVLTATAHRVPPGHRPVVIRGNQVRRLPPGRTAMRLPLVERVVEWPTGPVEERLQVRAHTRDGAEVRVLAEVTLDLSPPPIGSPHGDPIPRVADELWLTVSRLAASREVTDLRDPTSGLRAALIDRRFADGLVRVAEFKIAEINLLLPERAGGDR
ncbi:hypothetical protein [Microlunatus sp. Gsoil 973]|uniref:hypothetical protein n=1 Tax=Microlunatus sp. Gsoil 973 TaxID=2672569 RepID=UPI0012B45385|nr:hypothetical protein [Microlunatus sp. Gsoil 973]QGN34932.1 hypothetical protein GJV80_21280 [Microlunatus sp. Gsoil 973]